MFFNHSRYLILQRSNVFNKLALRQKAINLTSSQHNHLYFHQNQKSSFDGQTGLVNRKNLYDKNTSYLQSKLFHSQSTLFLNNSKFAGQKVSRGSDERNTKIGVKEEDVETQTESNSKIDEKPLTLVGKFKKMAKEYWYVLIPVHAVTSVVWIGSFYYASLNGVDIVGIMEHLHFSETIVSKLRDSSLGHVAIAYLLYKIASPARYAVTLGGTTYAINVLSSRGIIKPLPSRDQLVQMYKDKKDDIQQKIEDKKQDLQHKMEETKENIQQKVADKKDEFYQKLEDQKQKIEETKQDIQHKVAEKKQELEEKLKGRN